MKSTEEILEILVQQFGEEHFILGGGDIGEQWITISSAILVDTAKFLRDDERTQLDVLMCLSGVHYLKEEELGVTYHTCSTELRHKLTFKVRVPESKPNIPSLETVWKTADWHEREAYDMFGMTFDNHPNHTRILCPEDWEGHPLRKDYVQQDFYQGITTRE